ncbi:pyridoxamine 5'-phosphate oxidase family protein [Streptomyces sp. NPDC127033]|uniref:pyridoxamine 5'-phosphate oxidase family protein n=1 Tax=Streptomyces sp. NPDC127033 TaxID=3347110 RepID=UPI003649D270
MPETTDTAQAARPTGNITGNTAGSTAYRPTARTVPTRSKERASYDHELVHGILDQAYLCHLGFVRDGAPVVLPTLYARVGERLYVHGSTGSRPLRMAHGAGAGADADTSTGTSTGTDADPGTEAAGKPDAGLAVCLTVTHVDGLVLARSAFHHSINYRSVVVHGTAHQVTDPEERRTALDAIVDQVVPGRAADSRPANARELAATAVIRLDLDEVSAKVRTGGPNDEPEDTALPHWTGVVPLVRGYGTPEPAADLDPSVAVPGYLSAL